MRPDNFSKMILAIEREAAAMAIARAAQVGPVVTDKETLDLGMRLLEARIRESLAEEVRLIEEARRQAVPGGYPPYWPFSIIRRADVLDLLRKSIEEE